MTQRGEGERRKKGTGGYIRRKPKSIYHSTNHTALSSDRPPTAAEICKSLNSVAATESAKWRLRNLWTIRQFALVPERSKKRHHTPFWFTVALRASRSVLSSWIKSSSWSSKLKILESEYHSLHYITANHCFSCNDCGEGNNLFSGCRGVTHCSGWKPVTWTKKKKSNQKKRSPVKL